MEKSLQQKKDGLDGSKGVPSSVLVGCDLFCLSAFFSSCSCHASVKNATRILLKLGRQYAYRLVIYLVSFSRGLPVHLLSTLSLSLSLSLFI